MIYTHVLNRGEFGSGARRTGSRYISDFHLLPGIGCVLRNAITAGRGILLHRGSGIDDTSTSVGWTILVTDKGCGGCDSGVQ